MSSWIYIFSKFTPEALLLEALAIFCLTGGYAAFWILQRTRRETLEDARHLLRSEPSLSPVPDFQTKITEQAAALEKLLAEKTKLEKELADAKSQTPAVAGAGGEPGAEVQKLQESIQALEGRLAEYAVIEDDLANLKRLQQENAQLKAQLAGGTAPSAAEPAAPAPAAAAPAVEAEPAPVAAEASPASGASADPSFEGLVDEVEKSLQKAAPPAAEAASAPAPSAPPAKTQAAAVEKTDEDLIAEFEKMLNS